ncbi:MAG: DNA polymerase III subunit beta [Deltaproteobacteria bacterium]|nr:DNA polymerase III subunit beta [Deltaproteobacteria bacterium]
MKLIINKKDILECIANLQGITGRKTNLAITSCILIKTESSDTISINANDLETGFEGIYPAIVVEEGVIAVNSKIFFEIIKEYPDEKILITKDENRKIKIGEGKLEFNLVSMNEEEFPDNPIIEQVDYFEIDSFYLRKMISQTVLIGTTPDEKKAYINGVYFNLTKEGENKKIEITSTDGGRLSRSKYIYKDDQNISFEKYQIIPKKGLSELLKFIDNEIIIKIGFKGSNFILKKDNETITIRLLEGKFPEHKDILKTDSCNSIIINKNIFSMVLRRMSILSATDGYYKSVIFNFDNDKLTISSADFEKGESKEDIDIEYKGEKFKAAFNSKFFIDLMNLMIDKNIILYIKNKEKPCVIEGENDKTFKTAIMPMEV